MKTNRVACAIALTLAVYAAIHSFCVGAFYFSMDDLEELAHVRSMKSWWMLFGVDVFSLFRPIKNLLFALFASIGDEHVVVSRSVAIVIGMATYFPVLLFFRRVFSSAAPALAAAAVYLLAPTQVSCIAWLSCVNIQLMAGFATMALILHDDGKYVKASVLYLLACCSYECAITLPGVMLLVDLMLRPGRFSFRRWSSARPYVLYAVAGGSYLAVRALLCGLNSLNGSFPCDTVRSQIAFASASFLRDLLFNWVWPFGRMAVVGYFSPWIANTIELWACWLIPVALLAMALFCIRRRPIVSFGILVFFVGYLPVSNITGIGNGPYGDYYLAFGGLGLAIAYVEIVRWCIASCRCRYLCLAIAVVMIGVRAFAIPESARYAYAWSDDTLAHGNSVKTFPHAINSYFLLLKSMARKNGISSIGDALNDNSLERELDAAHEGKSLFYLLKSLYAGNVKKEYQEAVDMIERYKEALPFSNRGLAWYHYYKGCLLEDLGNDLDAAGVEYLKAIEAEKPWRASAVYFDRAARYVAIKGDVHRAIDLWRQALFWDDSIATAHFNISIALEQVGEKDEAMLHRQRAQELSAR